ncbi:MAG: polysulfide reductase [Myxococcales bacterium FL481]|nr:MAG: polysulfide reductase [Myxococcales bacterium FL481]
MDAKPLIGYPRFLLRCVGVAFSGNLMFYAWMTLLTALALVGLNAFAHQTVDGMGLTNMSDHVSWGVYIANLTYAVGLAAGAVMMVIPAYLYRDKDMHDVVIVGELLAITAVSVALAFVVVDIGRPDRFWHILPLVGRFNWPMSMLTWDVIVLNGYLVLNLHVVGYLIYMRYLGRKPNPAWYLPFVFLSIAWAISIHTVTAFLYSGLGGRPFWNSAVLAPRFIASAFVTGPAFIILTLQLIRRFSSFRVGDRALTTLHSIMRVSMILNLFLLGAEVFTEFYTGGSHSAGAHYLYFGIDGKGALQPWIWTAIGFNLVAVTLMLASHPARKDGLLRIDVACVLALSGIWIEKGMGLIVPGFVPSTLHEVIEYTPNLLELKVTVGIWAFGLALYTLGLKIAIAVFTGEGIRREGEA